MLVIAAGRGLVRAGVGVGEGGIGGPCCALDLTWSRMVIWATAGMMTARMRGRAWLDRGCAVGWWVGARLLPGWDWAGRTAVVVIGVECGGRALGAGARVRTVPTRLERRWETTIIRSSRE